LTGCTAVDFFITYWAITPGNTTMPGALSAPGGSTKLSEIQYTL